MKSILPAAVNVYKIHTTVGCPMFIPFQLCTIKFTSMAAAQMCAVNKT
jgi:hypothetical protein